MTAGSIVDQTVVPGNYATENCIWLTIKVKRLRPAIVIQNYDGKPGVDFGPTSIGEMDKFTLIGKV